MVSHKRPTALQAQQVKLNNEREVKELAMDFFSERLVSSAYRECLHSDLEDADLIRFLVAFISEEGINAIGRDVLVQVLRHEDSFGISSLACASGYKPLLELQRSIGAENVRLKYFMDPMVKGRDEPAGISLFHSKLVYLRLRNGKSVIYVGSHNWSKRALARAYPCNAEASLRFEVDYSPEHLTGTGTSIASQVNKHLLTAFESPACIEATPVNETTFDQWFQWGCRSHAPAPTQDTTIILAVQKDPTLASSANLSDLSGKGLYFQAIDEKDGGLVWDADDQLLVMVWNSRVDLQNGIPPVMLRCHWTAVISGPGSKKQGMAELSGSIAGFRAVIYDDAQLKRKQENQSCRPSSVRIWSGRDVEIFDFELKQQRTDSAQINGNVKPKYQFHLQVDHVIFPAELDIPNDAEMAWWPASFAVAKSANDAKLEQIRGYYVPRDLRTEILNYLCEKLLLLDRRDARNLPIPVEGYNAATEGKRRSNHPLHDTYINQAARNTPEEFYARAKRGSLVAEIGTTRGTMPSQGKQQQLFLDPIKRVQVVVTDILETLECVWKSIARDVRASRNKT